MTADRVVLLHWLDPISGENACDTPGFLTPAAADVTCAACRRTIDARDEIHELRRWKAEAMTSLAEWEGVWEAAGRPGRLGRSKASAVRRLIESLPSEALEGH